MLQSIGSQRVGHDWVTELNWIYLHTDAWLPLNINLHKTEHLLTTIVPFSLHPSSRFYSDYKVSVKWEICIQYLECCLAQQCLSAIFQSSTYRCSSIVNNCLSLLFHNQSPQSANFTVKSSFLTDLFTSSLHYIIIFYTSLYPTN